MKRRNIPVFTAVIIAASMLFVNSCLSDTRVSDRLGLLGKLESVAASKGVALDYDNYNQALAVAYYRAVYDKNVYELTNDEVSREFDKLFYNKDGKYATKYIGNILEDTSVDRELKNEIDHYYYGEMSTLAAVKSRGYYVSQNNQKYYDIAYSGDNMHISGCGPISLTMALNMLGEKSIYDAETLAIWAKNNGYMDPQSGTQWSFITDFSESQGFEVHGAEITDASDFAECFDGNSVIITVMDKGVFTDSGHIIVLAGMDSQNQIQVVDPISIYRTNKNWSADQIIKESKGTFWVISK